MDGNERIKKIGVIEASVKEIIERKSAKTLPDRPSELGYSADEIKRRIYLPILDATNSALAEIDRVINEVNSSLGSIEEFMDSSEIVAPFKAELDTNGWGAVNAFGLYEYIISRQEHKIEDYKEISVDMYLMGDNGEYVSVKNYHINPSNGDVTLFTDEARVCFVTICRNRDGLIRGDYVTDVGNILNIAQVAKTGNYSDLIDAPNLSKMANNEQEIAKIKGGQTVVPIASKASEAASAVYSSQAGTADKATNDSEGKNFINTYATQFGDYPNMKVGVAEFAKTANEAEHSNSSNYAELAASADTATNASYCEVAGKAATADYAELAATANSVSATGIIKDGATTEKTPNAQEASKKIANTEFVQQAIKRSAMAEIVFDSSVNGSGYVFPTGLYLVVADGAGNVGVTVYYDDPQDGLSESVLAKAVLVCFRSTRHCEIRGYLLDPIMGGDVTNQLKISTTHDNIEISAHGSNYKVFKF